MNFEKVVLANTIYQTIGKIITSGIGILTTAYLARYLGSVGFGEYSIIFSFLTITTVISDFGLTPILAREVASEKATEKYISNIFTFRLFLAILSTAISILLLIFFPYSNIIKLGIIYASFGTIFLQLNSLLTGIFQGKLEYQKASLAQTLGSLTALLLIILGITNKVSLDKLVIASVGGNFISFLVSYSLVQKIKPKIDFDTKIIKKIIKDSWPLAVSVIFATLYFKIDTIILSIYFNPSTKPDVGIYGLASKIFEVLVVFGTFFSNSLLPLFSKFREDHKYLHKILGKSIIFTIITSILLTTLINTYANNIVLILGGRSFGDAILPLRILTISLAVSLFYNLFANIILVYGLQKYLSFLHAAGLVFNLVFNLIAIPRFSFLGAASANLLTNILVTFGSLILVFRKNKISYDSTSE